MSSAARSITAFLYTVFAGSFFGACGVQVYTFLKAVPLFADIHVPLLPLFSVYYVGIGPAIIAGGFLAWFIRRRSWIGLKVWLACSVLFAVTLPAIVIAFAEATGLFVPIERWIGTAIQIIRSEYALMWITAILFASVGLRALLIASEVLLPPGKGAGQTHPVTDDGDRAGT